MTTRNDPAREVAGHTVPEALGLRSIRYLVAIVDAGSLAGAARELGVTQSALTRSVQADERTLGVRLLDRGKHGATPTAIGALVVERGRALLRDAQTLAHEVDLMRGADSGEVRIGAGPYPADLSVGAAVARLLSEKPRLKVSVSVGDWPRLTAGVVDGNLDVAVCDLETAAGDSRLAVEPLPEHPGLLFCRAGHPLAAEKNVSLEVVRRYPLAMTALPSRLHSLLEARGGGMAGAALPAIHVDTFQLARTIVLGSDVLGGAIAPQIRDDVAAGRVVVLPIELPWLRTRYGFVHRAVRTPAPSVLRFLEHVRAVEQELLDAGRTMAGPSKRAAPRPPSGRPSRTVARRGA